MNQSDKTKQRFASALKELCRVKPLNKISVNELVQSCDMNRSTFYYHFLDMDDLVSWIFRNDIVQPYFEAGPIQWKSSVLRLYDRFRDDCEFYRQAIVGRGENSLQQEICRVFYDLTDRYVRSLLGERTLSEKSIEYIARFYSCAAACVCIDYIKAGTPESPQWMTDQFFDVVWPGLRDAVENMLEREQ